MKKTKVWIVERKPEAGIVFGDGATAARAPLHALAVTADGTLCLIFDGMYGPRFSVYGGAQPDNDMVEVVG
jgi:hypothetical protein